MSGHYTSWPFPANGREAARDNAMGAPFQHDADRLLTIAEVAQWLSVSKGWVYDHVTRKQPRLPCIRFGELTRFRCADVEKFIVEHGRRDTNGSH